MTADNLTGLLVDVPIKFPIIRYEIESVINDASEALFIGTCEVGIITPCFFEEDIQRFVFAQAGNALLSAVDITRNSGRHGFVIDVGIVYGLSVLKAGNGNILSGIAVFVVGDNAVGNRDIILRNAV